MPWSEGADAEPLAVQDQPIAELGVLQAKSQGAVAVTITAVVIGPELIPKLLGGRERCGVGRIAWRVFDPAEVSIGC